MSYVRARQKVLNGVTGVHSLDKGLCDFEFIRKQQNICSKVSDSEARW